MHNITLISTNHSERGKCNSEELYLIIESINPDVVFEELPIKSFNDIYNGNVLNESLEVRCIKKYIQHHNTTKLFPVDIADPNRSSIEKLMFEKFERDPDYKRIQYEHNRLRAKNGFDYLNSGKCMELIEQMIHFGKGIAESSRHRDMFLTSYKLFYEDVDNRENAMLHNIYNYSKENHYNQAVFLLGCGHRKSMIRKIIEYEKKSEFKLNWTIYGTY